MPSRSTRGKSSEDDEERPRRSKRTHSVDYGDMEEEGEADSDAEVLSNAEESDEKMEDVDSEDDIPKKKGSRSKRKPGSKAASGETTLRKSSRATKFQQSMAEPDGQKEFLMEKLPSTRKGKKGTAGSKRGDSLGNLNASPQKSPARRHAQHRLSIKGGNESDDDLEETFSGSESDEAESDEEPLKIQRILASRTETRAKWKEICSKIQTSEIDFGSRWFQGEESINRDGDKFEERFLVKWSDLSYLHCSWETEEDLLDQLENGKSYIQTFFRKSHGGVLFSADERCDGDYFNPAFTDIERILEVAMPEGSDSAIPTAEEEDSWSKDDFGMVHDKRDPGFEDGTGRQLLVKWADTPYFDSTYEFERDLIINEVEYKEPLKNFLRWSRQPSRKAARAALRSSEEERRKMYKVFGAESSLSEKDREKSVAKFQKDLCDHVYKNGGQVRDYQAEGISWMISNYVNSRGSILADEMGLGKTLQTVATLNILATRLETSGVFLIIAPLSTLSHWEREFRRWTDLNTIVYHGSAEDRKAIREYEFAYEANRPTSGIGFNSLFLRKCKPKKAKSGERPWMAQVVITTPEMIVTDDFVELTCVEWEAVVIDEAHRIKNHNSKLAMNLRDNRFTFEHVVLLTGTPIQNDVQEFWTLLNFIAPADFESLDDFMNKYGDIKSKERVDELHEEIRPYILRRLKEDVEKSVPPKEETLIEVELTVTQKKFYRALYEKNVQFLHKKHKKPLEGPSLNNLAMQLRKCCNHLYMLNGVEEEFRAEAPSDLSEAAFLARGSGKLVLLDKLLPRLKEEGHRLLVFSQFKTMLDILEDYFHAKDFSFERIDGSILGRRRQQAIDRFQAPPTDGKESPFIMMLSTRAGGVGINLTAADTCIIFDSDWNPQNDLQAQARCHRIGQTRSVKVYRLLTRNTYEMQMFHMSSMKMGLDQAVLKGFESGEGSLSKDEVEKLLRHGAYDIFNEEKAGSAEAESNAFIEQDLDSILQRRSRTVIHENTGSNSAASGSTFSKASFKAAKTPEKGKAPNEDVDIMDPDFWKKMVGEGQTETAEDQFATKRRRTQANYSEAAYSKQIEATLLLDGEDVVSSDSDESVESDDEGELTKWGGTAQHEWKKDHVESLVKILHSYGYGVLSPAQLAQKFRFSEDHKEPQTSRMVWAMFLFALLEGSEDEASQNRKRDEKIEESKMIGLARESGHMDGGVLAEATKTSNTESKIKPKEWYIEQSLKKLWSSHATWLTAALDDALAYAKSATPNSREAIDKAIRRTSTSDTDISSRFASEIWPSLKTRGWKASLVSDGINAGKRCYSFEEKKFFEEEAVLKEANARHPELTNSVDSLLQLLAEAQSRTLEGQKKELESLLSLSADSITPSFLRRFLEMFAPIQLVGDRTKAQPIRLPKKLLSTGLIMWQAKQLVRTGRTEPGNVSDVDNLAAVISIDKRTALPHPRWTVRHDAVLIQAILKHGWIDQDSSCFAITTDSNVRWGAPFDPKSADSVEVEPLADLDLGDTAVRCVDFLNQNANELGDLKGLRVDHLARTYGLEEEETIVSSEGVKTKLWCVSDATLNGINPAQDGETNDGIDLPSKRELVRRAKAVLTRTRNELAHEEGQKPQVEDTSYGYAVLDQSRPPNVFLAELMRIIIKTPTASKVLLKVCIEAHAEATQLHSASRSSKSGDTEASKARTSELMRIVEQLDLVKKRMGRTARQAKNLVRVMLGEKPQQPRTHSETIFPSATVAKVAPDNKASKKMDPQPTRLSSKTSGERAVTNAVRRVEGRADTRPTSSGLLELTEVETLILITMCSFGLPVWREDWHNLMLPATEGSQVLTWPIFGRHLVKNARTYLNKATVRAALAKDSLAQLRFVSGPQGNVKEITEAQDFLTQSVNVCHKSEAALEQATQYAADAENLSKKAIMLIAKVIQQMGSTKGASFTHRSDDGLGGKVLRWLESDVSRWSSSLGLLDPDLLKPLAYTAVDFIQHLDAKDREALEVTSAFEKTDCRSVVAQVSMLTRLRSFLGAFRGDALLARLWSVTKVLESSEGPNWDKRPKWWGEGGDGATIHHEALLLERLHATGFDDVMVSEQVFGEKDKNSTQSFKDNTDLTRGAIQRRANQLVRELHEQENRSNDKGKPTATATHQPGSGQRTGILAFYGSTNAEGGPDDVVDLTGSDGKRKSDGGSEDERKKLKTG